MTNDPIVLVPWQDSKHFKVEVNSRTRLFSHNPDAKEKRKGRDWDPTVSFEWYPS